MSAAGVPRGTAADRSVSVYMYTEYLGKCPTGRRNSVILSPCRTDLGLFKSSKLAKITEKHVCVVVGLDYGSKSLAVDPAGKSINHCRLFIKMGIITSRTMSLGCTNPDIAIQVRAQWKNSESGVDMLRCAVERNGERRLGGSVRECSVRGLRRGKMGPLQGSQG